MLCYRSFSTRDRSFHTFSTLAQLWIKSNSIRNDFERASFFESSESLASLQASVSSSIVLLTISWDDLNSELRSSDEQDLMNAFLFSNVNLALSLFSNITHYYQDCSLFTRVNDEIFRVDLCASQVFRIFIDTALSMMIRIVIFFEVSWLCFYCE